MTTTTKNNVLEFPKNRVIRDADDIPEVLKYKEKGLKNYADATVRQISDMVLQELNNAGIDITTDAFLKDFYCTAALLHASVYRTFEFQHPCHEWIDSNKIKVDRTLLENIDLDAIE